MSAAPPRSAQRWPRIVGRDSRGIARAPWPAIQEPRTLAGDPRTLAGDPVTIPRSKRPAIRAPMAGTEHHYPTITLRVPQPIEANRAR
tara:strand:+ start:35 stop:298 length:264 start_codon:yes stop_codon:yes gene_type:complete